MFSKQYIIAAHGEKAHFDIFFTAFRAPVETYVDLERYNISLPGKLSLYFCKTDT